MVPRNRLPRPLALAAVLAALVAAGSPARAQVVVGVRGSGVQVTPGGRVTVPVVVDMTGSGGFSLGSLAAQLSWTPATLRYVGASGGTFGAPTLNPDSATGTLRFAVANPAGATGQVVVLQVTFDATGAAGDTTYLTVAVSTLTSAVTFTDLTPVTTSSLVCVGTVSGIWGDVDNSGGVTSFDALLVVTHAVGLPIAPHVPTLGDVDADGQVTTRDALIILSYVVSLPTPGFRPGQPLAGACGGPPPVAVAAAPASLSLVIGDTVPVSAVATDSLGQIASAPGGMAWASLDTSIAKVGPTGRVAAVGVGVTGAVVAVAPGVMDTVGVTVVTSRTNWYVDIMAAAQNPAETGSPAYPFSTLQQAVDRAAPNDTIYVQGGVYGAGARSTKPLAIIGHPSFVPPWFGGGIEFDSIGADTVRLERLVLRDPPSGIRLLGLGGGVALLDSVRVERAGAHGIDVSNFDSVALDRVLVSGAFGKGIAAADVRVLTMFATDVDGVSSGSGTGTALLALRSQRVDADSGSFRLGDVVLDTVTDVRLRQVEIEESDGALLTVNHAATVLLDTVSLRMGGASGYGGYAASLRMQPSGTVTGRAVDIRQISAQGLEVSGAASAVWDDLVIEGGGSVPGPFGPVAAAFLGIGRVEVRRGSLRDGTVFHADTLGDAQVLRLDTVDIQNGALYARNLDTLRYHTGSLLTVRTTGSLVNVDSVQVTSLVGVEASGMVVGVPAVQVLRGDSLRADSLYVHDNAGPGLQVDSVRTATSLGSRFERNAHAGYFYGNVQFTRTRTLRVAQGLFEEDVPGVTSLLWSPGAAASPLLEVDTTVFRGSALAIQSAGTATRRVRGSRLERAGSLRPARLLQGFVNGRVELLDNQVDTTQGAAYPVDVQTDTLIASGNILRGVYGFGATAPMMTVTGNTVECDSSSSNIGFVLSQPTGTISGNTVRRCWYGGIWVSRGVLGGVLAIRGNTVTDVSTSGQSGIQVAGLYDRLEVVLNTIQRGRMYLGGVYLEGAGGPIDTARVDSNTVQDGTGPGLRIESSVRVRSLRDNLVERQHTWSGSDAAIWVNGGAGPDSLIVERNRVQQNYLIGIHLGTAAPVRFDSNVVVDDSIDGVRINSAALVGRFNFIARNGGDGIFANGAAGPITISQSVIQQNLVGARFVSGLVTLANNYWGDPAGPDCDTGCAGALGDSLVGAANLNYLPFLTSPPATPVGAPPALRPGAPAAQTVAPIRPQAVEPAWFERRRSARRAAAGGAR